MTPAGILMHWQQWLRARDLDLLFGSYPYFIPKKLLREKLRKPAPQVHGLLTFFSASRLLDWVDQTDAIGWFLLGQKLPGPVAVG